MLHVYGDFNCPYSALASVRLDTLLRAGTDIRWRAVEHAPSIAAGGQPVGPELGAALEDALRHVRGLLLPGETLSLRVPAVLPNTALWAAVHASLSGGRAHAFRRRAFAAVWGAQAAVDPTQWRADARGIELARRWQAAWLVLDRPIVPALVLPDGYVSRGLGALSRLAVPSVFRVSRVPVPRAKGEPECASPAAAVNPTPRMATIATSRSTTSRLPPRQPRSRSAKWPRTSRRASRRSSREPKPEEDRHMCKACGCQTKPDERPSEGDKHETRKDAGRKSPATS